MELTLRKRNELTNALMFVFSTRDKLSLVLERDLGIELNSIEQNADTFEETTWAVVKSFEKRGKVDTSNFIIASSCRYPGNLKLQDFVFSNIDCLLEDTFEPIGRESLMKLVGILSKINSAEPLVNSLFRVRSIKERVQDVKVHKSQNIDFLEKNPNPYAINIYFLLDILKSYPEEESNFPNLLDFAKNLAINLSTLSASSLVDELNSWIEEILERLGATLPEIEVSEKGKTSVKAGQPQITDISLMIIISERKIDCQDAAFNCELKACLQEYNTQNGKSKSLSTVDIFDEVYSTTGKFCNFCEIEKDIEKLIYRSVMYISDSFENEPPLIIEVFLPVKWMLEKVDLWKAGSFQTEIGYQYQVVLRSYERLSGQARYLFSRSWKNFCRPIYENKDLVPAHLKKYVSHLQSESDFSKISKLRKKVAVKMTCPPPTKGSYRFFKSLVKENVPLAIWVRCNSLASVEDESWSSILDDFFNWDLLRQRICLLEKVLQRREEDAPLDDSPGGLGYYLSVLSDDPDRVPEGIVLDSHEE